MSVSKSRSSDRAYEIMLKRGLSKKKAQQGSGTSLAASKAIDNMATVTKRVKRGDGVDADFLATLSGTTHPAGAGSTAPKPPTSALVRFGGVAACVVAMVAVIGLSATMLSTTSHTVSGTLLLDRKTLPGVTLVFHPVAMDGKTVSVMTSEKGEFIVTELPEGKYKVAVDASESATVIPEAYRSPQSTPFSLQVQKDLANLRLFAVGRRRG